MRLWKGVRDMDNQTVITAAELKLKSRPIVGSVIIPTVYSTGSTIDANAVSGQALVPVTATGNFTAADRVILGRGTGREEEGEIAAGGVDAGVKITLDGDLTYNHTVNAEQTIDQSSAATQKKVYVTATAGLLAGETVVMDTGNANEESGVIASVNANDYITLVENLANTHAIGVKVTHTGIGGVVEVCMASLSKVIDKSYYKNIALSLPADWTTAAITFVGCMTEDGTFLPILNADDVGETTVASVAASMCIALNGEIKEAMAAIPFIKFRSGVLATPVDQGNGDVSISYALTR